MDSDVRLELPAESWVGLTEGLRAELYSVLGCLS